jgi:hypothetical protein
MEITPDTEEVTQTEENGTTETEIRDPKAVLEALDRAKNDAKKFREQFEAVETKNKEMAERIASLEGDEGIALWKGKAIELSAKAAMAKSGVPDPDRIYGFIDASTLDLDDDGRVKGLDEAVSEVKKRLPELFDKKRRVAGAADAFEAEKVKQELSTTELQLARLKARH